MMKEIKVTKVIHTEDKKGVTDTFCFRLGSKNVESKLLDLIEHLELSNAEVVSNMDFSPRSPQLYEHKMNCLVEDLTTQSIYNQRYLKTMKDQGSSEEVLNEIRLVQREFEETLINRLGVATRQCLASGIEVTSELAILCADKKGGPKVC